MVLSIGMIVKNEEKYLERCLTAIKPILDNVDSELIIADTGSTDNTVEIAKRFTDNVFHFEWINDFSAARNSTLDKARGEWYMFIDGDEIMQDCTPIIEFFNSGEYKNYGSANYIQRNYNDLANMALYSDFIAARLTALIRGVRFKNAIHENFSLIFAPVKYLNAVVDHYGYVYKDGDTNFDTIENKTSRNLQLLFRELEESEKNGHFVPTIWGQIADCYIWRNDNENALKYIDMGLEKCSMESYSRLNYYSQKVKTLQNMGRLEDVVNVCREYFSKENTTRKGPIALDCDILFYWAIAAFSLEQYDDVIAKSVQGLDIYRKFQNGKMNTEDTIYCSVDATIPQLKYICNILIISCIKMGKFNIALDEMKNIPLNNFMPDLDFMKSHLGIRLDLMEHTNYNKLHDLYYQLDKPNREQFVDLMLIHALKTEQRDHYLKKLAAIANDDERFLERIEIIREYYETKHLSARSAGSFIQRFGTKDNEIVLILMLMTDLDPTPFICAEDFDIDSALEKIFGSFFKDYVDYIELLFKFRPEVLTPEGMDKALEFFREAAVYAMRNGLPITKLLAKYGRIGAQWVKLHPNEDIPKNVALALEIHEIAELQRKNMYGECLEMIDKVLGIDSENAELLKYHRDFVESDQGRNAEIKEKQADNSAMDTLVEQIKEGIREMIDVWNLDGAEEALNQLAKMSPFDPDVEDIRDEIADRKINYMNYM